MGFKLYFGVKGTRKSEGKIFLFLFCQFEFSASKGIKTSSF